MTHMHLTVIDDDLAKSEIINSKKWLEDVIGEFVKSFCYPAGKYKTMHKKLVYESGFKLARTVKRFVFKKSKDSYALDTSVHTYDHWLDIWKLAFFVRFNPVRFFSLYRRWDKQAMAMFDMVKKNGGVFHLWGHSWEIEQHGDWERLENVIKYISGYKKVQYLTNSELYE